MNRKSLLLLVASLAFVCVNVDAQNQCIVCHESQDDTPSKLFKHDIHSTKGISCADCHGGNKNAEEMDEGMSKKAGFIGVPKGDNISAMCAKCHSSEERMKHFGAHIPLGQLENLQLSVHGKLSTSGKNRIVQCPTCHNAHGIVSPKNPASPVYALNVVKTCTQCHANAAFMRSYDPGMPIDQLDKYRSSVHGIRNAKGDPKTATCSQCHGSHDIRSAKDAKSRVYPTNVPGTCAHCHSDSVLMKQYGIPADQYTKYARSVHGKLLLEKKDVSAPACNSCHGNHGAAPPGVESVSKVCGTCHALNADLFAASPHKKAFDQNHFPECETCHGNHDIVSPTKDFLGTSATAICGRCHTAAKSVKGFTAANAMRSMADSLDDVETAAITLINDAEQKGMEVSEAKFKLRDVRQARLQSKTAVHAFDLQKFRTVLDKGMTTAALVKTEGKQAVDEYYFRRYGLGIATIIISILALSLYLFIKRLERRQAKKADIM